MDAVIIQGLSRIWLVTASSLLVFSCGVELAAQEEVTTEAGWNAWEAGDIDRAKLLATKSKTADGLHLLILCNSVKGQYDKTLEHYARIETSYARYEELDQTVVNAYLHLGKYDKAKSFAESRKLDQTTQKVLAKRAAMPMKVRLDSVSEIQFVSVPTGQIDLTDFFPGFSATINTHHVRAHIDTGGTFLHMNPKRASNLGIQLIEAGVGHHGNTPVKTFFGIADQFRIGNVEIENVPVIALPSLSDGQDFVIFGTNILEHFLATLDYPKKRMILSLRENAKQRQKHLGMLTDKSMEMPFYLWGDHYMFARGGVGDHKTNFFIDSGLVRIVPNPKGTGLAQVGLWATPENLIMWGLNHKGVFRSTVKVSLGPKAQPDLLVEAKERVPGSNLGGVRIHGLLSHAFLQRYTWTIDFANQKYHFR